MDNVREGLKEKLSKTTRIGMRPKTKKEVWWSLAISSTMLTEKRK